MCVVSMVHDYYRPLFPQRQYDWEHPSTDIDWTKLAKDYHEALKAAKKVDEKTNQPDCVDSEKAKLEAKVLELEARLAKLENKKKRRRKKKSV